jgi:hypothetical protein
MTTLGRPPVTSEPSTPASGAATPALRTASLVFAAAFLWILGNVVVNPLYGATRWSRVPVLASVVLLTFALPVGVQWVRLHARARADSALFRRATVGTALVACFLVQLAMGKAIRFSPGWDAQSLQGVAEGLATGATSPEGVAGFAATYPNNLFLTALLTRVDQLAVRLGFTDLFVAEIVLNAAMMTSTVLLAYLAARRLGGVATGYAVLVLSGTLIAFSPWIAVPYSDTVGMLFPTLVLYLFAVERSVARPAIRLALWGAMAFVADLGYRIKPTLIFALGAAMLAALLAAQVRGQVRRTLVAGGLVCACVAVGLAAGTVTANRTISGVGLVPADVAATQGFPLTHFLKMGAQRKPGYFNDYYGAYADADIASTAALPPGHDRFYGNLDMYRDRVSSMGPLGYASFLNQKADWTFGDGAFFMYGEGSMTVDPTPFIAQDPQSQYLQRWFGYHGDRFQWVVDFWQVFWLLTLLFSALPMFLRGSSLFGAVPTMARLALLMLLGFLLLFEARARYVYVYVPYFVVLASLSVDVLSAQFPLRRRPPDPVRTSEDAGDARVLL